VRALLGVPPIDPNSMWQEAIAFYGWDVASEELSRLWDSVVAAKATGLGIREVT
jgi:hypothetical protein